MKTADKLIEDAILSTLVVDNKQSIHRAVAKIKDIVKGNIKEFEPTKPIMANKDQMKADGLAASNKIDDILIELQNKYPNSVISGRTQYVDLPTDFNGGIKTILEFQLEITHLP